MPLASELVHDMNSLYMNTMPVYLEKQEIAHIYFSDQNSPDELKNYNSGLINDLNQNFYEAFYSQDQNPLQKTREIQFFQIQKILNHYLPKSNSTLLDIGCGKGDFVHFINQKAKGPLKAYGIEPSLAKETQELKKRSLQDISSANDIPTKFDVLTLLDVFEHFPNPTEQLAALKNLLQPDGLLLLKVPNKDSLLYRLGAQLRSILPQFSAKILGRLYQVGYPPPHYFYYNKASLKSTLTDSFEVVGTYYLSECPIPGLWSRLWGISSFQKPFIFIAAIFYRFISIGSLNDALVVVAKKKI